jgi:hypothetical protein
VTIEIIDCDQGSDEWFRARLGIPSASNFSSILAKGEGKTRRAYLYRLAAEIVTGEAGESFQSQAMERGKIMEDEARDLYAFVHDSPLTRVGFIINGKKGCSPDSLIARDGGLEIKTQRADLLVETLLKGELPPEHKAQVQGNMWVSERAWWDLVVYWPKMPLFEKRVYRDEAYIANLSNEVDRFNDELAALVERIRNYGKEAIAA